MSNFQSIVRMDQGFRLVGESAYDGPRRAQPYQIDPAATVANCVVGRMFSYVIATGFVVPGSAGAAVVQGTNKLAGILAMPKNLALYGTVAGGSLDPTLLVQPGIVAEFVEMDLITLLTNNVAAPGDSLEYHMTTGVIRAVRGAADANYALIPNCTVDRVQVTAGGGGLVVAKMTGLG